MKAEVIWGPLMRLPLARVTIRQMMVVVSVLSVPMAFWAWRLRAGFAFPAAFDLVPLAISVASVFMVARVLTGVAGDRTRLLGPVGWGLVSLNALIAVWFTSVEWSWIQEDCLSCGHGRDVIETRFFSIVPRREIRREFPRVLELLAKDLGIPCTHERMTRWLKHRWLGGCVPVEQFRGISRLWDPPWYPDCARDAVRSWSAEAPNFLRDFRARALEQRDRQYVRDLIFRMYDACPADQQPTYPLERDTELQKTDGLGSRPS